LRDYPPNPASLHAILRTETEAFERSKISAKAYAGRQALCGPENLKILRLIKRYVESIR
jgi:hypothetical protein